MRFTKLFPLSLLLIAGLIPAGGASAAPPDRPDITREFGRSIRPLDVKIETAS